MAMVVQKIFRKDLTLLFRGGAVAANRCHDAASFRIEREQPRVAFHRRQLTRLAGFHIACKSDRCSISAPDEKRFLAEARNLSDSPETAHQTVSRSSFEGSGRIAKCNDSLRVNGL